MTTTGRTDATLHRLTAYDLHCLRVETPARPLHIGILAVLDGASLTDAAGQLRLPEIRRELDRRLADLPTLRRTVVRPRPLGGRPVWVDDPAFRIERHVEQVALPAAGDQAHLWPFIEQLLASPLDRSRPLWRIWFVTGLTGGRMAAVMVLHHALADGVTAMRLVRSLLGSPLPANPTPAVTWIVDPPPPWRALVIDNVRSTVATIGRLSRPAAWRRAGVLLAYLREARRMGRGAAPSALNAPVGPRRRLATMRIELAVAKQVARQHRCGVNDVVLGLIAGGLRDLLVARGEPVEGLRPRAGVAVARFTPQHEGEAGNDIGTLLVQLPLGGPGPGQRLATIARERERAKLSPMVGIEPAMRALFGRLGILRGSLNHQQVVNLSETYLPGPPAPINVLGAPVVDLVPIAPLAGNLGLSFVALSYAGRLTIAVRADADRFPDLDLCIAGMDHDWGTLARSVETRLEAEAADPQPWGQDSRSHRGCLKSDASRTRCSAVS